MASSSARGRGILNNGTTKKELLASAVPGRASPQAPRFPTTLLSAMKELVMDEICIWLGAGEMRHVAGH